MGTSRNVSFFDAEAESHRSTLIEVGSLLRNGVDVAQRKKLCAAQEALTSDLYTLMGDENRTMDFSGWLINEIGERAEAASKNPHTREEVAKDVVHVLERTSQLVPSFTAA